MISDIKMSQILYKNFVLFTDKRIVEFEIVIIHGDLN